MNLLSDPFLGLSFNVYLPVFASFLAIANKFGTSLSKVTRFDRFWDDLKSEDRNPNDNITKLQPDEGLQLNGKVVIIQGVDETKTLPETVAGYDRWKNFQTLPIVCGIFSPYTEDPGVVYEEGIPGPVAPVIEGQDRPAEPGEGEDPGTGDVITGGPSNEAGSNESSSENSGTESDETGTSNPEPRDPRPEPRVPTPERPETETNPEPDTDSSPQPTPEPDTTENDNDNDNDNDNYNEEDDEAEGSGICWPWRNDCRN